MSPIKNLWVATAVLATLCNMTVPSTALECVHCYYSESEAYTLSDAEKCADSPGEELSKNCGGEFDACLLTKTIDANDQSTYSRSCTKSEFHDGETDSCQEWEAWGTKHTQCVCDTDNCNSAGGITFSIALIASVILKQIIM